MKKIITWGLVFLMFMGILPAGQMLVSASDPSIVVGTIDVSSDGTSSGNLYMVSKTGFTISTALPDSALALHFKLYVTRTDNPASISGFLDQEGTVELQSSGTTDIQEIYWNLKEQTIVPGWNDIILPFEAGTYVNGTGNVRFNKANINSFRIYNFLPSGTQYNIKMNTVEILDLSKMLRLSSCFGSGMLLQRDKPINITGTASPDHSITTKMFDGATNIGENTSISTSTGNWMTTLPAVTGGYKKYSIEIYDQGVLATTITDVVVGEQWLAAGQSNMQYSMGWTPSAQAEMVNPTDEYLRFFNTPGIPVGGTPASEVPYLPMSNINGASWGKGNDSVKLKQLSAIAYYFAKKLRAELDMPVGILNVAMGGTPIYGWLSREAIDGNEAVKSFLTGSAQYRSQSLGNWNGAGQGNYAQMTAMYNEKLAPVKNVNIAGMIWYQGETNSHEPVGTYRNAMNLLLSEYSNIFGFNNSSMPLIFSHIATHFYNYGSIRPFEQNTIFGEDMSNTWKDHPDNMAQIAIYDVSPEYRYSALIPGTVGDDPIHPFTKQPVGERMALSALGMVYGKNAEYTAPVYKSLSVSGDGKSLLLKFEHVGDGLAALTPSISQYTVNPGDVPLTGFTVAGSNGIYLPAKAEIVSTDTVRVWNDSIATPVESTYAFTEMNMYCNLTSTINGKAAFTAIPFRTEVIADAVYDHPKYWASCDLPQIWHSKGTAALYYDSWIKSDALHGIMTLSYDLDVKSQGTASLKVAYTTDSNKGFAISPKMNEDSLNSTPFIDIDSNLSKYGTMSFDVKNSTGRSINFNEMRIKGFDGSWYRPYVLTTSSNSKILGTSASWQTVTLDLTRLNKVGGDATTIFTAAKFSKTSDIQIEFRDTTVAAGSTGTIHLDNFVFGFKNSLSDFTVKFDSNGGSSVTPDTYVLQEGSLVSAPLVNPTRSGYSFGGWYPSTNYTTQWAFATNKVAIDTTLYAKWISSLMSSSVFTINTTTGLISKIGIGTTITTLLNGLNEKGFIKVYKGTVEQTGGTAVGTGMTLKLRDSEGNVKQTVTAVVTGDANGDAAMNALDLLKIKRHILAIASLSGSYEKAADFNGDKMVNALDLLKIKRHILGIET
jgi:uncharacterized repeat protein (TIGR02543 family)